MTFLYSRLLLCIVLVGLYSCSGKHIVINDTFTFGSFKLLEASYDNKLPITKISVLLSGSKGFDKAYQQFAQTLVDNGEFVIGVNTNEYIKGLNDVEGKCSFLPAHIESLVNYIKQKYGIKSSLSPALVGYDTGASLAYVILAQSSDQQFRSVVSIGFCPQLMLHKPLCADLNTQLALRNTPINNETSFLTTLLPTSKLTSQWIVLQASDDEVCNTDVVNEFVAKTQSAKIINIPDVGHAFRIPMLWRVQFEDIILNAFAQSKDGHSTISKAINDLPLEIFPSSKELSVGLAIIVSGDGGWASIDKVLTNRLNNDGFNVVGLNSLDYFWTRKTPERAAADLHRIIDHFSHLYAMKNVRPSIALIGYSRGADVLPFMVNRLSKESRLKIGALVFLAQEPHVDFQFHVSDWLTSASHDTSLEVMPEMHLLAKQNVLCVYGIDEKKTSTCSKLDTTLFKVVQMPGGHHFNGQYEQLADIILEHIE